MAAPLSASASTSDWLPNASLEDESLREEIFPDSIDVNSVRFTGYDYPDYILERSRVNSIYKWSLDANGTATLRGSEGEIPYYWITASEYRDLVKNIDIDVEWFPNAAP